MHSRYYSDFVILRRESEGQGIGASQVLAGGWESQVLAGGGEPSRTATVAAGSEAACRGRLLLSPPSYALELIFNLLNRVY